LVAFTLLLFLVGLWPFNFNEKNNAVISPAGGLEVARHGTAYTFAPAGKLQDLKQFAIHVEITSSSDGLNSFEKIFSYFINQEEMNFILGQWKDGLGLTFRTEKAPSGIKMGLGSALKEGERTMFLIRYDGKNILLYQDGRVGNERAPGPAPFSNWDRTYPLVVGTDADGRSQWKGTIYEIAVFDRAVMPGEIQGFKGPGVQGSREEGSKVQGYKGPRVQGERADSKQPTADSRQQETRKENPPASPFTKKGGQNENAAGEKTPPHPDPLPPGARGIVGKGARRPLAMTDDRALVHYVFRPENTYETEFRGKKALAVRDLGKGEAADLVIPEQFTPYQRYFFRWDPDWMKKSSGWLDLIVNIVGFLPFGLLLTFAVAKKKCLSVLVSECLSEDKKEGFGIPDSGVGIKEENPPVSPMGRFATVAEVAEVTKLKGKKYPFMKEGEQGGIAAGQNTPPHPDPLPPGAREILEKGADRPLAMAGREAVQAVVLAVVVGFGVSLAIELIQAYLPSRDSSLRDLVTNVAGTMIGAVAATYLLRKRESAISV